MKQLTNILEDIKKIQLSDEERFSKDFIAGSDNNIKINNNNIAIILFALQELGRYSNEYSIDTSYTENTYDKIYNQLDEKRKDEIALSIKIIDDGLLK